MTYASANRRPSPAALAGAFGIPAAFGALLIAGLAVTVVTVPRVPNPKGTIVPTVPLPPPPPVPEPPRPDTKAATTPRPATLPLPPTVPVDPQIVFPVDGPIIPPVPGGSEGPIVTGGVPAPLPSASPYTPVGARPKGNAGGWITDRDYARRWIIEELEGTAAFALSIDAGGKVSGCTITRSTGHAPLDAATCELVSKRARFEAARDGNGKPVAGSYKGSVTWRIPE